MADKSRSAQAKAEARRASNRRSYAASKPRQERALLRLEVGSLAALDAASATACMSRSSFSSIYLIPLAAVLSERLPDIDRELRKRRISLSTFLARAIDAALADQAEERQPPGSTDDISAMLLSLCEQKESPCCPS